MRSVLSPALRASIEGGAAAAEDPGIVDTIRNWISGTGDSTLSAVQRIGQLDPQSPDFVPDLPFGESQTRLQAALGNWQRLRTAIDALWGGIQKLPAEFNQQLDQLQEAVPRTIGTLIRRAHDEAVELFHAGCTCAG